MLHFGHNMLWFHEYREPKWISGAHIVDMLWLLITPILIAGWWLAYRGPRWASLCLLTIYSILSMFTLGHYLYASPMQLSFQINFFILAESLAALLLLVFAPLALRQPKPALG